MNVRFSESFEQLRHTRFQPPRDNLKRNEPGLSLSAFDVRDVAPIHVQRYGHISLSPAHRNPQGADALAYLYEQGMIFAGHAFMVTL